MFVYNISSGGVVSFCGLTITTPRDLSPETISLLMTRAASRADGELTPTLAQIVETRQSLDAFDDQLDKLASQAFAHELRLAQKAGEL